MNDITAPLEQIINTRKYKLQKLKEAGINPYPSKYVIDSSIKDILEKFKELKTGEMSEISVSIAGRILSKREMGKASFIDVCDFSSKIQIYFKADFVGAESYKIFKDSVDISDFIGVKGTPFRTRTGELSIKAESWSFLSKALRPLPEKWHGLKDTETRYRQRYLDLIANNEVKEVFIKRSRIISTVRNELAKMGFIEVETPMMQSIPGGAAAKPFITHHNALNIDLFLRIAPELYLKRLVIGGMEKVYEIGRNFRNEGIDRSHNPEFTMLELYQAYVSYEEMMDITEKIIQSCAIELGVSIPSPFKRIKLFDVLKKYTNFDLLPMIMNGKLHEAVKSLNLEVPPNTSEKKLFDHIFDKLVAPNLIEPTFIMDYPTIYSPLAKTKPDNPDIVERFELFIKGKEVANAYSELNDAQEQAVRFKQQLKEKTEGDEEAQPFDEDFILAMEHGLPPTGGLGIGIDRLVMVLSDIDSIREVILFPLLRNN